MKSVAATCAFWILALITSPALACIPISPNPERDAVEANAVFYGIVVAEKTLNTEDPLIESSFTINVAGQLKGVAPRNIEVIPRCGDHGPRVNERVIIIQRGEHYTIRKAGDEYEHILVAALGRER